MLTVLKAGLQTTIQAGPRHGYRHFGVPSSGPADAVSMALANRLVSQPVDHPVIETTLTWASFRFRCDMQIAITGAMADITLGGRHIGLHKTHFAEMDEELVIGPAKAGCRNYLALSASLETNEFLGSGSTYLPGRFGGRDGSALAEGDRLAAHDLREVEDLETPLELKPFFNDRVMLQVAAGPDFNRLSSASRKALFEAEFTASQRASRMGVELTGNTLAIESDFQKESAAVFPGSVQCPPEGNPYVLLADAQTTGGYPHILQVIRSDRFQLGQIRPGSKIRFVQRSPEEAAERYRARWTAYSDWLEQPFI